jgi:hypothetical protein
MKKPAGQSGRRLEPFDVVLYILSRLEGECQVWRGGGRETLANPYRLEGAVPQGELCRIATCLEQSESSKCRGEWPRPPLTN